jgi:hypothetical protein
VDGSRSVIIGLSRMAERKRFDRVLLGKQMNGESAGEDRTPSDQQRSRGARMVRPGIKNATTAIATLSLCSVLKAAQLSMASAHEIHDTCRSQAATHIYSFGDVWHCVQQSNCSSCIRLLGIICIIESIYTINGHEKDMHTEKAGQRPSKIQRRPSSERAHT